MFLTAAVPFLSLLSLYAPAIGVVISSTFFVQIAWFLPSPLHCGRESFSFAGGTCLWVGFFCLVGLVCVLVFDLKKNPNPRNQRPTLFLKLNSPETIKPWELEKKAERIKRTAGSRCSCADLAPLEWPYQGEDELWEWVGARLWSLELKRFEVQIPGLCYRSICQYLVATGNTRWNIYGMISSKKRGCWQAI